MEHLMNFVNHDGQTYYVSTADTFDVGLETMVFKCKKRFNDMKWTDDVSPYSVDFRHPLHTYHPKSEEEAEQHHKEVVQNIGEYIWK